MSFARTAIADGTYQRTRDGKTIVWNQDPKPGDAATWSGDRDRDGYATGFGTLTWYTGRETVYARYFGNMTKGKFNGPVNGHSKGVTGHALFVEGKRTSPWAAGPASSWKMPQSQPQAQPQPQRPPEAAVAQVGVARTTNTPTQFFPPPPSYNRSPAERPAPNFDHVLEEADRSADIPAEGPGVIVNGNSGPAPGMSPAEPKPKLEIDDSLRSLTGPPEPTELPLVQSFAEQPQQPETSSSSSAVHLTSQQALELADAEARRRGFDIEKYQRPDPQFDSADNIWSLFYVQKQGKSDPQLKYFIVAIDDKTKRTAVVRGH